MSVAVAIPKHKLKFKTVAEFEAWVSDNSNLNDKRFEFINGKIIEKPAMKQEEVFISDFLTRLFTFTKYFKKGDTLQAETDSHIDATRKTSC